MYNAALLQQTAIPVMGKKVIKSIQIKRRNSYCIENLINSVMNRLQREELGTCALPAIQFRLLKCLSTGRKDCFYCWIMKRFCLKSLLTQGTVHCFYRNHSSVCILNVYQLYIALKNSTMKLICSLHGMYAKGPYSLRVISLVQQKQTHILSKQLPQNHKGCSCSFCFNKQDTMCSLESFRGVGRPFIPPIFSLCGKIRIIISQHREVSVVGIFTWNSRKESN